MSKGQRRSRERNASLLAGLLFDDEGEPLIPVHTNKAKQRYRYYVSKALQHGSGSPSAIGLRLPAREIEQVVRQEIASLLGDPLALAQLCGFQISPAMLGAIIAACAQAEVTTSNAQLKRFINRIVIHSDRLDFVIVPASIAALFKLPITEELPQTIVHSISVRLTRTGHAVRLIEEGGAAAFKLADPALIRLLLKARRWWSELAEGKINIPALSKREGISPNYVTRVVRLAFLAPDVVEAILAGTVRADIDGRALLMTDAISLNWIEQETRFLPGPHKAQVQSTAFSTRRTL